MNFSGAFLFISILALGTPVRGCDLLEKYPHTGSFELSNGNLIPIPTHSTQFDTYSIYGFLDLKPTIAYLKNENISPMTFSGHAIGALSVFDYKDSDIGPFRESYFVILTKGHNGGRFSLYHERVWSNTLTASLMSKEIWGIPSKIAKIGIENGVKKKFFVHQGEDPIFDMSWVSTLSIPNPFAQDLIIYAVGPKVEGIDHKWSPVEACRNTSVSRFMNSKGDNISIYDAPFKALIEKLNFKPFMKEIGYDQQAAQFLPQ